MFGLLNALGVLMRTLTFMNMKMHFTKKNSNNELSSGGLGLHGSVQLEDQRHL